MVSQKKKWIAAASIGVLAAGGWLTYSLLAKQGQGTLAQYPLNIQNSDKPALIMALDDSGSMLWEVLNNTRDGVFRWNGGFFDSNKRPYGFSDPGNVYHYVTPAYGRDGAYAIPPLPAYGFARSPDVNPAYFDPRETYPDWKTGKVGAAATYLTIKPDAAPVDPRPATRDNSKIDLTQNLIDLELRTDANWSFRFFSGMVIPVNTLVQSGRCGVDNGNSSANYADGKAVPTGFRRVTRAITVGNNCSAAVAYYPATFYLKEKLPVSYGYKDDAILAVTNPAGGMPGTLYRYEIRKDNFTSTAQYDLAIKSFANWFSFYRTRREALIGAASNALQETDKLRVGWFRINGRSTATMYDMQDDVQKPALIADIMGQMRAGSTTPNRSAAAHLGAQFMRSQSRSDPNPPVLLSCQKNAGMLFTDGYINETSSRRMRSMVETYYDNSLVPGLEKYSVPIPKECPDGKLDCKTNLHMNFYGVTLGTLGEQFGVTYKPDPLEPWVLTPNPYEVKPKFGTSPVNLAPAAVDELWEAVLYTHGEMINANNASDITTAMRRIISNVSKGATPSGTRSLTGARIGKGSLSVEPFYEATNNGTDWYSTLSAFKMSVDPATRAIVSEKAWEASAKMPAAAARNVWFWRKGESLPFKDTNVSLSDLCSKPEGMYSGMRLCGKMSDYVADNSTAISYLLGNSTQEARFRTGKLRDRTTVLGDIINSTPLLTSPSDDYGYRRLGNVGSSYVEYLKTKRDTRRYTVYAGANDGMLHAFDGGMGIDGVLDSNGGREVFGYIPSTALGHMGNLLIPYNAARVGDVAFEHRYYVDGPVVVGDTHDASGWKTSLVGTSGAGGRSVFALDVSDPSKFGKDNLLWELSDMDGELSEDILNNIGHVLGKPVIVPVRGKTEGAVSFKAIFGNGVDSKNGKAVLFVVDMEKNRKPTFRIYPAEEKGDNLPAGRNGLMNIVVVDRWGGTGTAETARGRDGFADTVYAADQKGAIWKFDLRGTASPTKPLFTTKTSVDGDGQTYRQPIMGGMTATAGAAGGVMLMFGTGSFSFSEDRQDTSVQSLYGFNDTSTTPDPDTLTSANLRPITVTTVGANRQVTLGTAPAGSRGWAVNLPAGERFVANPTVTSGVVFMPTYVPKTGSSTEGCIVGGANWLFGLNTSDGSAGLSQVRMGTPDGASPGAKTAGVPLDTGGSAPVKDVTTAVVPRLGAPEKDEANPPPTPPGTACMMQVSVAGAVPMYLPYPCGRQSWRQIK